MKMNFYSVFDKGINAYMRPFPMQADGQAVRAFTDECLNAETPLSKHPEDYALFRIGSFEDTTGVVEGCEPKPLARGHEVVAASRVKE